METEDLDKIIDKVNRAMEFLADIDLYNYGNARTRKLNHLKLLKSYDILFKTKNHLNFIKKRIEKDLK